MIEAPVPRSRPPSVAPPAALGVSLVLLGLLDGGLALVGAGVGAAGLVVSLILRRRAAAAARVLPLLPVVIAAGFAALVAPPSVAADLAAGAVGLSILYWFADEPTREEGVTLRAAPALGMSALAVGLAWAITLFGVPATGGIALPVALLAVGLVALAILLSRIAAAPAPRRTAPPPPSSG